MKDGDVLSCDFCAEYIGPATRRIGQPKRFCTDCLKASAKVKRRAYLTKRRPRRLKREADARYTASGKRNITRKATELAKLMKEKRDVTNRTG